MTKNAVDFGVKVRKSKAALSGKDLTKHTGKK